MPKKKFKFDINKYHKHIKKKIKNKPMLPTKKRKKGGEKIGKFFRIKKVKGFQSKQRGEIYPSGWGVIDKYNHIYKITKTKSQAQKMVNKGNKKLKK